MFLRRYWWVIAGGLVLLGAGFIGSIATAKSLPHGQRQGGVVRESQQSQAVRPASVTNAGQDAVQAGVNPADVNPAGALQTTPVPAPTPSPTASPSPAPTFAQLNQQFGPCAVVPTLMYHHVEDLTAAKTEGHAALTVGTPFFRKHLEYLRNHGYTIISVKQLASFFDEHTPLPAKPVILTFDDGYADMASDAWPLLKEFNAPATFFIPTGLMENPGYLTWAQIKEMAGSGPFLMGNHTWSHHTMAGKQADEQREVSTAKQQLHDHGVDSFPVFAYPYGTVGQNAATIVGNAGYSIAFTTVHGKTLCKGQRLQLPRIRVGNANLQQYGL